jgi:predicted nucleotidyltransferase component of viral defense system
MIELLQERLERYEISDSAQQEQALKEIFQELILYALWRNDFFEVAAFQGGTCLRILYGLPRFSEGLDCSTSTTLSGPRQLKWPVGEWF